METCLLLRLCPSLSLWYSERPVTFTGYESPPFLPLSQPWALEEKPRFPAMQYRPEIAPSPYQTDLPARPRPVPCTLTGQAWPRQSQLAQMKRTDLPESWLRANIRRPEETQSRSAWQQDVKENVGGLGAQQCQSTGRTYSQPSAGSSASMSHSPPQTHIPLCHLEHLIQGAAEPQWLAGAIMHPSQMSVVVMCHLLNKDTMGCYYYLNVCFILTKSVSDGFRWAFTE